MLSSNRSINKKNLITTSPSAHLSSKKLSISAFKLNKTLHTWPEVFEDRKKLFEQYSHGKSYIPPPELKKMIEKEEIFQGVSTETLRKSLKHGEICANFNSRGLDRKEFPYFLRNLRYFFDLQKLFESLDSDKDNRLKKAEFLANREFLSKFSEEAQAERIFQEMDIDFSGTVSFEEFCNWALRQPEILHYNNREYFKELQGSSTKLLGNLNESLEEGETLNFNRESSSLKESLLRDLRESVDFLGNRESQELDSSEEMLDLAESPVRKPSISKELEVKRAEILALRAELLQKDEKIVELFKENQEKALVLQENQEKFKEIEELSEKIRRKEAEISGLCEEIERESKKCKENQEISERNTRVIESLGEEKESLLRKCEEKLEENRVIEEKFKETRELLQKEESKTREKERECENLLRKIEESARNEQILVKKLEENAEIIEKLQKNLEFQSISLENARGNAQEKADLYEKLRESERNSANFLKEAEFLRENLEKTQQTCEEMSKKCVFLEEKLKNQDSQPFVDKLEEMKKLQELQENNTKGIYQELKNKEKIISELLEKLEKGKKEDKRCEVCKIF